MDEETGRGWRIYGGREKKKWMMEVSRGEERKCRRNTVILHKVTERINVIEEAKDIGEDVERCRGRIVLNRSCGFYVMEKE